MAVQQPSSAPSGRSPFTPPMCVWNLYPDCMKATRLHESIDYYVPGGFHPVSLRDTLRDGRYTIRHKLGYGGQSTVWLASDAHGPEAWVAIKIKSAAASAKGVDQDAEIRILCQLEEYYCRTETTQPRWFARLLDSFQHTGPNGVHTCIVTDVMGPTLSDLLDEYQPDDEPFPPDFVLRSSQRLLQALDLTHRAGIVHGDISPRNIAYTFSKARAAGWDLLEMAGSEPATALFDEERNGKRPESLPAYMIASTEWLDWDIGTIEDLRLIDWGWSFAVDKPAAVATVGQPDDQRSPETFFMPSLTDKHDLWRAGGILYALVHQQLPFHCIGDRDHYFIRRLVAKLGPLPPAWHAKWREMLVGYKYEAEAEAGMPKELLQDTFEPRRQQIFDFFFNYDNDNDNACSNTGNTKNSDKENIHPGNDANKNKENVRPGQDEHAGMDDNTSNDADADYDDNWTDEFTEYDVESLKCLLKPMQGLMRFELDKRMSLHEAASLIKWKDYRRDRRELEDEEDQEIKDALQSMAI